MIDMTRFQPFAFFKCCKNAKTAVSSFHLANDIAGYVPRDLGGEELVQTGSSAVGADRGARLEGLEHEWLLRVRAVGRVHVDDLLVDVVDEFAVQASTRKYKRA